MNLVVPPALKKRWLGVTAVYITTILIFYTILLQNWSNYATRWLGITILLAIYCLHVLWKHLPQNHRASETAVLPTLGWGNSLTLLRGLNMSMMAGFLLSPWTDGWLAWVPAILYTTADIADYLDGYAARKTNHTTQLGETLDMEFDGLGLIIVSLLAIWYGQLPWWYLIIGFARYFFVFGLWLRKRQNLPEHPMIFSWHRRIFAGFQMGFMSVVLWPIVPAIGATIAGTMFALATSASFLRDWLLVIGWLDAKTDLYRIWQQRIYRFTAVYLPPIFRTLLLLCMLDIIGKMMLPIRPYAWADLFTSWGLPFAHQLALIWLFLGIFSAFMIFIGAAGRIFAILILFPIGFDMVVNGASGVNSVALICTLYVLMLGTGALSFWQPEEKFMTLHAGA